MAALGGVAHLALPEVTPPTRRKVLQLLAIGDVAHLWLLYQLDGFRSNVTKLQGLPSLLLLASRVGFLTSANAVV